jgi:hypothetical protein
MVAGLIRAGDIAGGSEMAFSKWVRTRAPGFSPDYSLQLNKKAFDRV